METLLRGLHLPHVQRDEIRTRLQSRKDVLRLWPALDPLTKIVRWFTSGRARRRPPTPWSIP
jgi:hypothetical protein